MTKLYEELIRIIKLKVPAGMNPVDVLIDIIPMSKEAAYRRLRGEIDFSLEEVVRITRYFDISIDALRDSEQGKNRFGVQMMCVAEAHLPVDRYQQAVNECIDLLKTLKTHPNAQLFVLTDIMIPMFPIFKYEMMSKYYMFKWMYRCSNDLYPGKLKDMYIPDEVTVLHHQFIKEMQDVAVRYICPPELMLSHVREVTYFRKMELLTDDEVRQIKQETNMLLDEMGSNMMRGKTSNNMPFSMNLSYFGFDTTCIYYHADTFGVASVHMFGDGFYYYKDPRIVHKMKHMLDALVKNSVLISVSGEKQRLEFMNRQREMIHLL